METVSMDALQAAERSLPGTASGFAPTNYHDDIARIRRIDLNLLRVFDAIAVEGSMTSAARRLGLTQPGLSRALGRLRSEFDDKLFVRGRDGLMLTSRAESAYDRVRAALRLLEQALSEERTFEPATASRLFTLAAPDYCEAMLVRRVVARMESEAPNISLHSVALSAPDPGYGVVDFVLSTRPPALPGVVVRKLVEERFACIVRRGHPALRGGVLAQHDFLSLKHVGLTQPGQAAVDGKGAQGPSKARWPCQSSFRRRIPLSSFRHRGSELVGSRSSRARARGTRTPNVAANVSTGAVPNLVRRSQVGEADLV